MVVPSSNGGPHVCEIGDWKISPVLQCLALQIKLYLTQGNLRNTEEIQRTKQP